MSVPSPQLHGKEAEGEDDEEVDESPPVHRTFTTPSPASSIQTPPGQTPPPPTSPTPSAKGLGTVVDGEGEEEEEPAKPAHQYVGYAAPPSISGSSDDAAERQFWRDVEGAVTESHHHHHHEPVVEPPPPPVSSLLSRSTLYTKPAVSTATPASTGVVVDEKKPDLMKNMLLASRKLVDKMKEGTVELLDKVKLPDAPREFTEGPVISEDDLATLIAITRENATTWASVRDSRLHSLREKLLRNHLPAAVTAALDADRRGAQLTQEDPLLDMEGEAAVTDADEAGKPAEGEVMDRFKSDPREAASAAATRHNVAISLRRLSERNGLLRTHAVASQRAGYLCAQRVVTSSHINVHRVSSILQESHYNLQTALTTLQTLRTGAHFAELDPFWVTPPAQVA